jgi:hypothetical protein
MTGLRGVTSPVVAGVLIICALAIISLYTSIGGLIKAEMFPVEVRALGVGCRMRWRMRCSAARRNGRSCSATAYSTSTPGSVRTAASIPWLIAAVNCGICDGSISSSARRT